ncbi:AhpC/TSA family protein [Planctomycetes bacterium Pan216]|uniref:AhpC/TSA family protein n=2 Tax=Kolteria novifilia TaxID=2527975 RepID=A0A518B993_9BACT|nr:AhpC/TSA family protein [Planctomycetes bacterium Pan216]
MRWVSAAALLVLGCSQISAEPLELGAKAPTFSNLQTAQGKTISSSDFDKDALVVCITCNHCPVAKAYQDRLKQFEDKYGDKADLVAINVNLGESDGLEAMKKRASEEEFNFDYAIDPSQKVGEQLGARVTPEFFVFDKDRKLVYTGAFDDNMNAEKVSKGYVEEAVNAVLSGGKAPASTKPVGCGIRYEK